MVNHELPERGYALVSCTCMGFDPYVTIWMDNVSYTHVQEMLSDILTWTSLITKVDALALYLLRAMLHARGVQVIGKCP